MRSVMWFLLILMLISGSAFAERKNLEKLSRKIPAGASEIMEPNPQRQDGYDIVIKQNKMVFDSAAGEYIYTYYRENGEEVNIRYEPSNRVDVTVECNVAFDEGSGEYTYTYVVKNKPSSKQALRAFAVDIHPGLVLRTESFEGWAYYSNPSPPPDRHKWAFWGSAGHNAKPGETITFTLVSVEGPAVVTCRSSGKAKAYKHPYGIIDKLGVPSTSKEGVIGKTLGPGIIEEDNTDQRLREFFSTAREWGWIDSANYATALDKIPANRAMNASQFQEILRDFKEPKPGQIEPEIPTLLKHIGRKRFNLQR